MKVFSVAVRVTVLALSAAPASSQMSSNTYVAEGLALPLVRQKVPVYDRTGRAWVYRPQDGINPVYSAAANRGGGGAGNRNDNEWTRVHGRVQSVQSSPLQLRAYDGRMLTVDLSPVSSEIRQALQQGEGVTVIGHEWTGSNRLRAEYIQQDSSDPSRGGSVAPSASPRR